MGLSLDGTAILAAATATGAGSAVTPERHFMQKSFQAFGSTSAGLGAVSVDIEVSNDKIHWIVQRNISLTLGVAETTDGYTEDACWKFYRANVASISGTNAQVTVLLAKVI